MFITQGSIYFLRENTKPMSDSTYLFSKRKSKIPKATQLNKSFKCVFLGQVVATDQSHRWSQNVMCGQFQKTTITKLTRQP